MSFLPLKDIRVLELAEGYAGPWAATLLGDFGAEVVKIEAIQRMDLTRSQVAARAENPNYPGLRPAQDPWNRSLTYILGNRNKLDMTLDLAGPEGRRLFYDLVKVSDVVLTNMVTGVPEKLGIDYETLRRVRPDIVYLATCGFGASGPYARHVAMATSMDAASGHMWLRPYPDRDLSSLPRGAHNDAVNGLTSAFAVMVALNHRAATGQGLMIDVSGCETIMPHIGQVFLDYVMNGRVRGPLGNGHPWAAPHGCYRCKGEDHWIAIAVESDEQWQALCRVMGNPAWAREERFATGVGRWRDRQELDQLLERWTRDWDHRDLMARLQAARVPAGAVLDNKEVAEDPHFRERRFFQEVPLSEEGERIPLRGAPWTIPGEPFAVRVPPAGLGQHNGYVYGELLGLAEGSIHQLRETGILGEVPLNRLV